MGICCGSNNMGNPIELKDMPEPDLSGVSDQFHRWELRQVFARTPFLAFKNAVRDAETAAGGQGFVTLKTLSEFLNTQLWRQGLSEGTPLGTLLTSSAFKDDKKGQSEDEIDADILMMFGILHCRDKAKPVEKAKGLYDVLQEGGMDVHKHISAGDKDTRPVFLKFCRLVTVELFEFSSVKVTYSEDEVQKLEDILEDVLEDWLDTVYDVKSTLVNEAWIEKVTKEGKLIFDAELLRAKVFEKAGVNVKHMK